MTTSRTSTDSALRVGIVLLTLATALIHLQLAFPDLMFILNGLGYLALLAALYLPIPQLAPYRNIVRWVFIGYTALTLTLWLIIGERTAAGFISAAAEVALIVLLLLDARRD